MPRHTGPLFVIAMVLIACSSGDTASDSDSTATNQPSGAVTSAGSSGDADLAPFVEACLATTNMGRSLCECTAGKAASQLGPDGFAYLTASVRSDDNALELGRRLSVQEMTAAATFMVRGPAACAREAAGAPRGDPPPAARP